MSERRKCRYCGKWMTGRADKAYCSDRCRYADWKGRQTGSPNTQPCEYCGMPADSIDHVPPQTVRPFMMESGLSKRIQFVSVWACRECNCYLGAKALFTIEERKRFIKKVLRLKYKKYLKIPDWSDSELSRVGYTLEKAILYGIIMKEMVISRINW